MSNREFTIVYKRRKDKYIAWIEEIPGVNTQGKTLKEIKENLKEAAQLVLSANRLISMKNLNSGFKKETIQIPV